MTTDIPDLIAGALGVSRGTAYDLMRDALAHAPAVREQPRLLSAAPCDQCGYNGPGYYQPDTHQCAAKHHKALAEQPAPVATPHEQQEPVAWSCEIAEADFEQDTVTLKMQCSDYIVGAGQHWLTTTHPQAREWVGLTNNELQPIADEYRILFGSWVEDFARAIEAKLREKNEHREKNT